MKDETDTSEEKIANEVFFAPLDEIRNIERILINLEKTRHEFQMIAEKMKSTDN